MEMRECNMSTEHSELALATVDHAVHVIIFYGMAFSCGFIQWRRHSMWLQKKIETITYTFSYRQY